MDLVGTIPLVSHQAVQSMSSSTKLSQSPSPTASSSNDTLSTSESDVDTEALHGLTPLSTGPPSEFEDDDLRSPGYQRPWPEGFSLSQLYAENILAKVFRTATVALASLPDAFPEIVLQTSASTGLYSLREADFWTCGFFPGTMYAMLERLVRYPESIQAPKSFDRMQLHSELLDLCHIWTEPIRKMDHRTDTHDIGFIIMPALRLDWELHGNRQSLNSIVQAARSLGSRYVPSARAIRSWDLLRKKDIEILDQKDNMIVIIDSLCNLDLLYYAANHTQDLSLASMATAHAVTLLRSHLRPEPTKCSPADTAYQGQWYSTCHVANLDPRTGGLKCRLTGQGFHRDSTWSRGQAWAVLGYAETYGWTKDRRFLDAACGLCEYFLYRLTSSPACVVQGRKVPLWDFDASIEDEREPLRDSSAGVIAANGMLVLSQALTSVGESILSLRYLQAALAIVHDTLDFALAPEKARLCVSANKSIEAQEVCTGSRFDGLLKFGTANNNADAKRRYANHGLVYGDYYLVMFGNRLLRMGIR